MCPPVSVRAFESTTPWGHFQPEDCPVVVVTSGAVLRLVGALIAVVPLLHDVLGLGVELLPQRLLVGMAT